MHASPRQSNFWYVFFFYFILVNDVEIEGYYVFEDGTEVDWVSTWHDLKGVNENGILFGTQGDSRAGSWSDDPITQARPYICEKSNQ